MARCVTRSGNNTPEGLLSNLVEQSLNSGVHASFEVDGHSMLPFIRPGDIVRVKPVTTAAPREGDVVVVQTKPGSGIMMHRVVKRTGDKFVVRGDNTTVPNGEFARAGVLGMVIAVERGGRSVWFGAGRWGRVVAWAVRHGVVNRLNRLCLKFRAAESRLRQHKGDDGNE